jgi:hypothetical protein
MNFVFYGPPAPEGGREAVPFTVALRDVPQTPEGRLRRLTRAAAEAIPTGRALRAHALAQMDEGAEVVVLVCAVDCAFGRSFVERRIGLFAPVAACGVFAFVLTLDELAGSVGPQAGAVLAQIRLLEVYPGDEVWVFAVNGLQGLQLDARVMRIEAAHPASPPPPAASSNAASPPGGAPAASPPPGERFVVLDEHAPAQGHPA